MRTFLSVRFIEQFMRVYCSVAINAVGNGSVYHVGCCTPCFIVSSFKSMLTSDGCYVIYLPRLCKLDKLATSHSLQPELVELDPHYISYNIDYFLMRGLRLVRIGPGD